MRSPTPLFPIIVAKLLGGSGGGSVTPASIVSATGQMTSQQAADTLNNISGEPEKFVVNITADDHNHYSADKTLAELNAAYSAGEKIEFHFLAYVLPVVYYQNNNYQASIPSISDTGAPAGVISIFYNLFGIYAVYDGPFAKAPISITCTMTSSEGGTWTGATFAELQAACAAGRLLNANVVGVANVTAFMQDGDSGTSIITSPIIFPSSQYGVVTFLSDGTFFFRWIVTPDPTTVTDLSSTNIALAAAGNTVYNYGELSALTISSFPATGKFWIWFTSGATPTTTVGIENFVAEANKRYKITVEDNYATYDSWPYSPT